MSFKDELLDLAARLDLAQPLLSGYAAVSDDLHVPDVDRRIREFALSDDACRGEVLFPLIPGYATWSYRACLMGHAFRTRGYRPILLVADGGFDVSPAATVDEDDVKAAELSRFYRTKIPERFGMETLSIRDALPSGSRPPERDAIGADGHYRGVDVDRYAVASTRKYLKRYTLDGSDGAVRTVHDAFLRAGIRLADACHAIFQTRDVAATVVNEPVYVQGGIPADVSDLYDVSGYSQMLGYRDETILFGRTRNRSTQPQFSDGRLVDEALATPLTESEREDVERIMDGRKTGDANAVHYSAMTDRSVDVTENRLLVGMFTNLLWDASLEPEDAPYTDVYEWVEDTVSSFETLDDAHLVLKVHPAEAKFGTRESITNWIDETYGRLPENVTLLPPSTDVNTYELVDDLDVGIVYTSTVGLEMAYEGVPVVVAGDTHYRGFGFTIDPADPTEYRATLGELDSLETTPEAVRRARRYAHFLFVRKHVDFPYFTTEGPKSYRLLPVEHGDLTPGNEPWDSVVESILDGRAVLSAR